MLDYDELIPDLIKAIKSNNIDAVKQRLENEDLVDLISIQEDLFTPVKESTKHHIAKAKPEIFKIVLSAMLDGSDNRNQDLADMAFEIISLFDDDLEIEGNRNALLNLKHIIKDGAEVTSSLDHLGAKTQLIFPATKSIHTTKIIIDSLDGQLDAVDEHGETPFYRACLSGKSDVAKYLMEKGGAIDSPTKKISDIIHHLAAHHNDDFNNILDLGIDINAINKDGLNAAISFLIP